MNVETKTKAKFLAQWIRVCNSEKLLNRYGSQQAVASMATAFLGHHVSWVEWDEDQKEAQLGLRLPDPDTDLEGRVWEPSIYLSLGGEVSSHANAPLEEIQARLNQPL